MSINERVQERIEGHLGSHDVARVLYGTIVGLALILALEGDKHGAGATAAFIVVAALVVGLAELFSEVIAREAGSRARLSRRDMSVVVREARAVVVGAGFPAIYFLLSALGAWSEDTAFKLAKWSGLILVCAYAYVAAKLAGTTHRHAAWHAVLAGVAGVALVQIKSAILH